MTGQTAAASAAVKEPAENGSYELFMGILSILSIGVMVWIVFVRDPLVQDILIGVDLLFCLIFLVDFARSFARAPSKPGYLWPRGIIDLLSSLPGLFLTNIAILRVLRLFRIARVVRILGAGGPRKVARDFLANREQSVAYLIVLAVILVVMFGSIGAVLAESDAEGANIKSAGDAIWWAFVTITTVGYGDRFPVTLPGRLIAVLTMATGIAIFGVVTSLLSSFILGGSKGEDEADVAAPPPELAVQVADLRAEIVELRALLERRDRPGGSPEELEHRP
jgi:voltage-gated potassium channel